MTPSSSKRSTISIVLTLLAAFASTGARADLTSADLESARALYKEALDLRKGGNESTALVKLKAAYALTKSPVIGVEVARSEIALGKLVDAREQALEIEALPVTSKETKASAEARAEAVKLAAELASRIAFVVVRLVDVPPGTTPIVTIDGAKVPIAALGQARAADPGVHVVEASVADAPSVTSEVRLAEGEERDVVLSLATHAHASVVAVAEATPHLPSSTNGEGPRDLASSEATTKRTTAAMRFELGARAAYGLPMGDADASVSMSSAFENVVPLWLDAGIAIGSGWFVGGYFQYGVASVKSGGPLCPTAASACSAHDVRVGVEVAMHIPLRDRRFDPWFGVGFGYEWLTYGLSASSATKTFEGSETLRGLELLNLQLGCDAMVAPSVGVGPFIAFSLAKYSDYSYSITSRGSLPQESSGSVDGGKLHQWIFLGVRGALRL